MCFRVGGFETRCTWIDSSNWYLQDVKKNCKNKLANIIQIIYCEIDNPQLLLRLIDYRLHKYIEHGDAHGKPTRRGIPK